MANTTTSVNFSANSHLEVRKTFSDELEAASKKNVGSRMDISHVDHQSVREGK